MNNLAQKLEYLKWLKSMGIEYYFSDKKDSNISLIDSLKSAKLLKKSENIIDLPQDSTKQQLSPKFPSITPKIQDSRILADSCDSIDQLRIVVTNFTGCPLKDFALNTVFSDGIEDSKIMLIGEAPGAKEDELGIPFCGESGILLDTMLKVIGLSRQKNIYITNTIFWRPPANRKPTKKEMEICKPFVEKHIALINPKLLICVGSTAVSNLLGDNVSINYARANKHTYSNKYLSKPIDTVAIFHPAYLLRQAGKKKDSWFDLIRIQQYLKKNL